MKIFGKKAIMDSIRCDEEDYLVYKWQPQDTDSSYNSRRSNAIRFGSSLRVRAGEVAVFVYKQDNGIQQEFIYGPYDQILETKKLPILDSIIGLAYGGNSPFQAEVYFINLAKIIQVKFGIPYFNVYDSQFPQYSIPIAVRGTVSFYIKDCEEFIALHKLENFSLMSFIDQTRDAMKRYVKSVVAKAPIEQKIPVIQIESTISWVNREVEQLLKERFAKEYGVIVNSVDIGSIELDKESDDYEQYMSITKSVTTATIQAQTSANVRNIYDRQMIDAEDYRDTLRRNREEVQYTQRKQTQATHMDAYRVEAQTEVGVASANAIGQMRGTTIEGGVGNGGFNPTAVMASMALGSEIVRNLSSTMKSSMEPDAERREDKTPPIPKTMYNIVENGKSEGPYELNTLIQLAQKGDITRDTLVWKPGMDNWEKLGDVSELAKVISAIPPKIPT